MLALGVLVVGAVRYTWQRVPFSRNWPVLLILFFVNAASCPHEANSCWPHHAAAGLYASCSSVGCKAERMLDPKLHLQL